MSDNRRNATLKALIDAVITELMIKTTGEQIYLDDQTTLSSKMAEMVAAINLRDKKTDVDAKISTLESNVNTKLETKADLSALGDLATKDKVAKDDLDTALQTELDSKATTADVDTKISALQSSSDTKFSDTDKAINLRPTQTEVTEQIAALKQEIMGDLPVEAYDTFTELAAYIEEHQEAANALTAAVGNKADKTVVDDILTVINALGALAKKDKVSKDDLDASLQTELDAKATTEAMNTALATKSDIGHTHTKEDIGLGNVGNFKAVSTVADQGLTDEEKANARSNIGAGASSFSGNYNDLSNKPTIDSYLSASSTNAVQNKVVKSALDTALKGKIIDGTLTSLSSASTLPYNFYSGSAVVYNNEIHILGSADDSSYTKHYKWDGTIWTEVSTLPYNFCSGSAVVYNNEIHILGSGDSSSTYTNHYKWDGTSWTEVSTLPYIFVGGSAVVYNNEIHILGSADNSSYTKHYKWNGTSWTEVSTLPYEFYFGSAVVYNNEIHILGSGDSSSYTKHYKWNGTSWSSVSTLPYAFYYGSAVVYNNEIHILGGGSGSRYYKWNSTSWSLVSNNLPLPFMQNSAVVYNNEIHMLGNPYSGYKTVHYKYDPAAKSITLTLTDSAIKADSILDIYVDQYGVSPINVTSEVGSVTLTFDSKYDGLNVRMVII